MNNLIFAILLKAIEDYKLLVKYNVDKLEIDEEIVYKSELKKFFNSQWCDWLLSNLTGYNGRDIMRFLDRK